MGNFQDAIQVAIRLAHLPENPEIIGESNKSFSGLLKQISSEVGHHPLESLSEDFSGPSLEYRLR
jgi:hypothetical protein